MTQKKTNKKTIPAVVKKNSKSNNYNTNIFQAPVDYMKKNWKELTLVAATLVGTNVATWFIHGQGEYNRGNADGISATRTYMNENNVRNADSTGYLRGRASQLADILNKSTPCVFNDTTIVGIVAKPTADSTGYTREIEVINGRDTSRVMMSDYDGLMYVLPKKQ